MNTKLDELLDEFEGREVEATRSQDKELPAIQAALERAKLLEVGERKLATSDCMDCFVRHGRITKMASIPSDNGIDIFRCRKCWDEKELDFESG